MKICGLILIVLSVVGLIFELEDAIKAEERDKKQEAIEDLQNQIAELKDELDDKNYEIEEKQLKIEELKLDNRRLERNKNIILGNLIRRNKKMKVSDLMCFCDDKHCPFSECQGCELNWKQLEELRNDIKQNYIKKEEYDKAKLVIDKMAEDLTTPIHNKEWVKAYFYKEIEK